LIRCLSEAEPAPFISVDALAKLVNDHHFGIGSLTFRVVEDSPGAPWGNIILRPEDRTSPYEEPFRDAEIFINSSFFTDESMRRLVGAKELMHVFDSAEHRAGSPEVFRLLVQEIASSPMLDDASMPYRADREALWKAIVALIPPWLRNEHKPSCSGDEADFRKAANILKVPPAAVRAAMGDYYEKALVRFKVSN
jgi:hypothetical protein